MLQNNAGKPGLLIFILLVLPIIGNCQVVESGSFYQFLFGYEPETAYCSWISHVSEGIAAPGYNDYAPWERQTNGFGGFANPDSLQTQQWTTISNYFVNQQWANVSVALTQYNLPYDIVQFYDTDTDRQYYMLRERLNRSYDDNGTETLLDDECGSFDLGWGLFVLNPEATSPIIITVAHPNDDFIAIPLAWKAFTELNARFLMIAGAGREVMWTQQGNYTNSQSLSDPSRNAAHPLHLTYKLGCDEIRARLANQNSIIGRELSIQVHSYDTAHHLGYANCQVSAGSGQGCTNLPIRDLSKTQPDLINAAGYTIHAANTIGNNAPVLTNNFWAVYYNLHPFYFDDGLHQTSVSSHIDLTGTTTNCQMLYSINQWTNYDVYDPFFHIEMDELPNCYTQNDSTLAWFYGRDDETRTWDPRLRYQNALAYYTPWIEALEISLEHTLVMNDNHAPVTPVLTNAILLYNSNLRLTWQSISEYDFDSYIISMERRLYLGNGNYTVMDTLIYDRNNLTILADPANTIADFYSIPLGYHYRIWLSAIDKSGRSSGISNEVSAVTYSTTPMVTNLSYDRTRSDESHITISWTPIAENIVISGYRIERRDSSSWYESQVILPQTANSYTDSLFNETEYSSFQYRIVTLGASGQTFTPTTNCTGYFRRYPAPANISIIHPSDGFVQLQWQPVNHTLIGFADSPDYYLITKSSAPDFSSADTQSFEVLNTDFHESYPDLPIWQHECFYKITAKARTGQ